MTSEEGDDMDIKKENEYAKAAIAFSFLSLIGAALSVINAIPIIITYQLLLDARRHGLSKKTDHIISILLHVGVALTIYVSLLYMLMQF